MRLATETILQTFEKNKKSDGVFFPGRYNWHTNKQKRQGRSHTPFTSRDFSRGFLLRST